MSNDRWTPSDLADYQGRSDKEVITYSPNDSNADGKYVISYQSLREDYRRYKAMPDDEFRQCLVQVLHFTCIVCWFKESQAQRVLSDIGIIHELVHLLDGFYQDNDAQFQSVRELFNSECELT